MNKTASMRTVFIGVIALIISMVPLALQRIVLATNESFTTVSNKTVYEQQVLQITDLQIEGTGDDQLNMNLYVNNGSLQFNGSEGLTFDGPSSGSNLQFSGSRSDINNALSTLRYTSNTPGTYTIEATLGGGEGDVYNPANGHVYQVVQAQPGSGPDGDATINWDDAKSEAESMSYGGVPGYLATITSQAEHEFIQNRISQDGWIGANDVANEGDWKWVTGPEANTSFWSGTGASGSAVSERYSNWNQSGSVKEPNNAGSNEDCAEIRFTGGANGQWNDRDCASYNATFVVEFGTPSSPPTIASTDFQVTVNAAPPIAFTNLVPADNSEVNSVDSVAITYNQQMETGEGYLRIYNAADDSVVKEFDIAEGDSDDNLTYTYELSTPLKPGQRYYVEITDSAMSGLIDYYDGFSDKTTWNFTIVDGDGISAQEEDAAPNNGDGNNDGVQDSDQANVASFVNPNTSKYVVLEADDECAITQVAMMPEPTSTVDGNFEYPAGLMDFALDCGTNGFTTTINQYYYDISNNNLVMRKYNPNTAAYSTISSAVIAIETIDDIAVVKATYQVTDGEELDLDGQIDGKIVDPAGLALQSATTNPEGTTTSSGTVAGANSNSTSNGAPNTGLERRSAVLYIAASILGATLLLALFARYSRNNISS